MQTRRTFLRSGALAAGALAFGPAFWRDALAAAPATPGPGPYGPLGPPDANGFRLPEGFSSRVVARANTPVPGTTYQWHIFPDGKATYPTADGGWILADNSETPVPEAIAPLLGLPVGQQASGGASAIRFRPDGSIADAYRILSGTSTNCAGGRTPWGTWMSCEEIDTGRVWECDPTGVNAAVVRPAMGVFKHEAVAVDPDGKRLYLTEDTGDGGFYRFTPDRYPDCASGLLEIATVASDGVVRWTRVPDPSAATTPTREQVPGYTEFRRGEGIWFDSGIVYVATTSDNKIHAYDTRTETIEALYDASTIKDPPLTGVDNITVSPSGDLFVCEDNGGEELDIGIITPDRVVAKFMTATGDQHRQSELAGPVFDPSGTRLYFSSQRSLVFGATYEVTGPFRTQRVTPAQDRRAPSLTLTAPRAMLLSTFRKRGLRAGVRVNERSTITLTLTARLNGRTVTLARNRLTLAGGTPGDSVLRPTAAARRRLAGRNRVSATLTAVAVDAAGNRRVARRTVLLRSAQTRRRTGPRFTG